MRLHFREAFIEFIRDYWIEWKYIATSIHSCPSISLAILEISIMFNNPIHLLNSEVA